MGWYRCITLWSCITALIFQGNSNWSFATRIYFHHIHGEDIMLFASDTIAKRTKGYCLGMTFSNRPVRVNEHIHVKIVASEYYWAGNLLIGFTAMNPVDLQPLMSRCLYPNQMNNQSLAEFLPNDYTRGYSEFYFYFNERGAVMYGNRQGGEYELFSGITNATDLWAVLHLYGQTSTIQILEIFCSPVTCQNRRSCSKDDELNILRCSCPQGYNGQNCEAKIFCTDAPCENNGSCSQDGPRDVFRCSCISSYQGLTCQEKILCANDTCKNGGFCTQDGVNGVFRCTCTHGYHGLMCKEKILCNNGTCKNGGSCTQDGVNGIIQCSCERGYNGLLCEVEVNDFLSLMLVYIDVIGAVVGAILLIIIIAAVFKIFRSKKNKRNGEKRFSALLENKDHDDDTSEISIRF